MENYYFTKRQDHANRRNAGEEISLENKLKQIDMQQRLRERTLNTEIRLIIDKQRKLGHRTFSLPDEIDVLPSPAATPLRKRIFRASKVERIEWDARSALTDTISHQPSHKRTGLSIDTRSVLSDQPYIKKARHNQFHTMGVLGPPSSEDDSQSLLISLKDPPPTIVIEETGHFVAEDQKISVFFSEFLKSAALSHIIIWASSVCQSEFRSPKAKILERPK
eukprot:sb/3469793/